MEDVVLQRVKRIIEDNKLSVNAFATNIGMLQGTVNNYILAKRGLSYDFIMAILTTYDNISAEWLLRGEGNMLKTDNAKKSVTIQVAEQGGMNAGGNITSTSAADSDEMKRLRLENQQLRERCDKLTDKLLATL